MALLFVAVHSLTQLGDPQMRKPVPEPQVVGMPQQTPVASEVPVVTLAGRRHAERTSYSILANLGITDTVATTGGEYVDVAVRLATDRAFASDLRARIRAALAHSVLTDMPRHARNLEDAYLRALDERVPGAVDGLS